MQTVSFSITALESIIIKNGRVIITKRDSKPEKPAKETPAPAPAKETPAPKQQEPEVQYIAYLNKAPESTASIKEKQIKNSMATQLHTTTDSIAVSTAFHHLQTTGAWQGVYKSFKVVK